MASSSMRMQPSATELMERGHVHWGAVWGGVFTFAAIWTVFESLAVAIFGHAVLGTGMAVWTIILTIIAMYVAGRETARLAGLATKHDGVAHGLMMFGLSVIGMIALFIMAMPALNTSPDMREMLSAGLTRGMDELFYPVFWLAGRNDWGLTQDRKQEREGYGVGPDSARCLAQGPAPAGVSPTGAPAGLFCKSHTG